MWARLAAPFASQKKRQACGQSKCLECAEEPATDDPIVRSMGLEAKGLTRGDCTELPRATRTPEVDLGGLTAGQEPVPVAISDADIGRTLA